MASEVVCGSGDQHHVDQVVEELEETDSSVLDHVTVGSRRLPEPGLELPKHRLQEIGPWTSQTTPADQRS